MPEPRRPASQNNKPRPVSAHPRQAPFDADEWPTCETALQYHAITYPQRLNRVILQGGFARRPLIRIERGLARVGRYWPWLMGDLPIRETSMRKLEAHAFVTAPKEIFETYIKNRGRNRSFHEPARQLNQAESRKRKRERMGSSEASN